MLCKYCGYDTTETNELKPDEYELQAARVFYEETVKALKGHFGEKNRWDEVHPCAQAALALATSEFKKRYVCAG